MAFEGFKIQKVKILLVEGTEDQRLIDSLLKSLNVCDIQSHSINGKDNLKRTLNLFRKDSAYHSVKAIGVIRDADFNPQGAFNSVRNAFIDLGMQCSTTPKTFTTGNPRTGILILPDSNRQGSIEDLCLGSVQGTPTSKCVDGYFECLKQHQDIPKAITKAKIHSYLSSLPSNPTLRLGESAQANIWDWKNPAFDVLKDFIVQM
jgi:hypothetical protein